jgi:predicted transcriptional regulator
MLYSIPSLDSERKRRRDNYSIINEILGIAIEDVLKTQIMYKANLSFPQLNKYLEICLKSKLLRKIRKKYRRKKKEVYRTTRKGLRFQREYKNVLSKLDVKNSKELADEFAKIREELKENRKVKKKKILNP